VSSWEGCVHGTQDLGWLHAGCVANTRTPHDPQRTSFFSFSAKRLDMVTAAGVATSNGSRSCWHGEVG
jgi:hypothetical protein